LPAREGADRQHIAMRELDDIEHTEEQREADRDERNIMPA